MTVTNESPLLTIARLRTDLDAAYTALRTLRRGYFVAGGEMTTIEACTLLDKIVPGALDRAAPPESRDPPACPKHGGTGMPYNCQRCVNEARCRCGDDYAIHGPGCPMEGQSRDPPVGGDALARLIAGLRGPYYAARPNLPREAADMLESQAATIAELRAEVATIAVEDARKIATLQRLSGNVLAFMEPDSLLDQRDDPFLAAERESAIAALRGALATKEPPAGRDSGKSTTEATPASLTARGKLDREDRCTCTFSNRSNGIEAEDCPVHGINA